MTNWESNLDVLPDTIRLLEAEQCIDGVFL